MGIYDTFHRHLAKTIVEKLEERTSHVANGNVLGWEDYKEQIGYLRAFKDVLGICDDISKEMYGVRERDS
jgi:hypothetical protein